MAEFDPRFLERSPMLAPLAHCTGTLRHASDWPTADVLQPLLVEGNVRTAAGLPLRLVAPGGGSYERGVYERGELEFRDRNWHDFFNVLAWLAYPRTKAALNARHALELEQESGPRGRVRDALTLFDESGAIVVSDDASLLDEVRRFEWKRLFVARRADVRMHMRFYIFGHALLEKVLAPYVGLTAHALLVETGVLPADLSEVDGIAARHVGDVNSFASPRSLAPLPVLGVPGWWPENEIPTFYEDTRYFRPGRRS